MREMELLGKTVPVDMFELLDYLESVDSTNDYLKQFVAQGEARIAVAREQTAGKGRYGREWLSSADLGLYVSYLFFPRLAVRDTPLLNKLFSLGVLDTIGQFGKPSLRKLGTLKAPNDVLIRGKKVCGILAEIGSVGDEVSWAIVGIGINLNHEDFPDNLSDTATSLKLEGIRIDHPLDFCEVLTEKIVGRFEALRSKGSLEALEREYRDKLI